MPNQLSQIEHVVVLMLENRSFDNLLGWLYDPANPAPFNTQPPGNFNGVYGKNLTNSGPKGSLPVGKGNDLTAPHPDPGEPYQNVYAQIYLQQQDHILSLGEVPAAPANPPGMQGFVYNYSLQPGVTDPSPIMNCFTPASVPVFSNLAYYYGLCDHWFSSIPTQTICNRSYLHACTSSGYVNNEGGDGILFLNESATIFNLLTDARLNWKVYSSGWIITSLALLTQRAIWGYALDGDHFAHLHDFLNDAKRPGGLPAYSFIEPNYIDSVARGPENDMHPESHTHPLYGLSNVGQGEKLVYDVYSALRSSPDWEKTLLIITFDEHGGCYDHVPPPTSQSCPLAVSPDGVVIAPGKPGASGFKFDRLGVRVPALIISAYTPPQTVLNQEFDHTAVATTLVKRFTLPDKKLGSRQQAAQALPYDLGDALSLPSPRKDEPPIPKPTAAAVGIVGRAEALAETLFRTGSKPVSERQRTIVRAAAHRLSQMQVSDRRGEADQIQSALDADAVQVKLEADWLLRKKTTSRKS